MRNILEGVIDNIDMDPSQSATISYKVVDMDMLSSNANDASPCNWEPESNIICVNFKPPSTGMMLISHHSNWLLYCQIAVIYEITPP